MNVIKGHLNVGHCREVTYILMHYIQNVGFYNDDSTSEIYTYLIVLHI